MEIIEPHAASRIISPARIMVSSVDAKNCQRDFMLKSMILAWGDYVNKNVGP